MNCIKIREFDWIAEERKKDRALGKLKKKKPNESSEKCFSDKLQQFSKEVVIGINALTRKLEKNQIRLVLLSADVQPQILIQVILFF